MNKQWMAYFLLAFAISGPARAHEDAPISEIIVFGDSLSDVGNLSLASGGAYAPPPYFAGRASNGPLWVERLATHLDVLRVTPALLGGTDQAWAGGETGDGVSDSGTPNLGLQVEMFLATRGLSGAELVVIWAGANDVFEFSNEPEVAAANIVDNIVTLSLAGGRRYLVLDLDGIERTPAIRGTAAEFPTRVWVDDFRHALARELEGLEKELEDGLSGDFEVMEFEVGKLFVDIIDRPRHYGMSNSRDPACPGCNTGLADPDAARTVVRDPDQHVFWDFVHPTRVVHDIIGEQAADVVRAEFGDDDDNDDDSDSDDDSDDDSDSDSDDDSDD